MKKPRKNKTAISQGETIVSAAVFKGHLIIATAKHLYSFQNDQFHRIKLRQQR